MTKYIFVVTYNSGSTAGFEWDYDPSRIDSVEQEWTVDGDTVKRLVVSEDDLDVKDSETTTEALDDYLYGIGAL